MKVYIAIESFAEKSEDKGFFYENVILGVYADPTKAKAEIDILTRDFAEPLEEVSRDMFDELDMYGTIPQLSDRKRQQIYIHRVFTDSILSQGKIWRYAIIEDEIHE